MRSSRYFQFCSCFRFPRKFLITLLPVSCQNALTENSLILTASCKPCPAGHYQSASGTFWVNVKLMLSREFFYQDANFAVNQYFTVKIVVNGQKALFQWLKMR